MVEAELILHGGPENIALIFLWNVPAICTYFDQITPHRVIYPQEITIKWGKETCKKRIRRRGWGEEGGGGEAEGRGRRRKFTFELCTIAKNWEYHKCSIGEEWKDMMAHLSGT